MATSIMSAMSQAASGDRSGSFVRDLIAAFTLSRLAILALGFYGVAMFVDQHTMAIGGAVALDPEAVWRKWDVLWYERIALHGYGWQIEDVKGQAVAGFFPLYPVTVGLLLRVLPGLSFFWVGALLSNIFTFTALVLIGRRLVPDATQARRVLLILLTAAGSFYLSIPYTESLFLLLVVLAMIATRRRHYLLAGLLSGLAFTTRIQGLALIAVPLIACRLDDRLSVRARVTQIVTMLVVFGVPMLLYMAYLREVQGSAEAFIARQSMWENAVPYPFKALVGLALYPKRVQGWLHGGVWCLYLGLLIRYWKRMPLGEALFCLGALVISTQQELFHGIYRYVVPLVPIAIAQAADRDRVRLAVIGVNLVLAALLIIAFVTNNRLAV